MDFRPYWCNSSISDRCKWPWKCSEQARSHYETIKQAGSGPKNSHSHRFRHNLIQKYFSSNQTLDTDNCLWFKCPEHLWVKVFLKNVIIWWRFSGELLINNYFMPTMKTTKQSSPKPESHHHYTCYNIIIIIIVIIIII